MNARLAPFAHSAKSRTSRSLAMAGFHRAVALTAFLLAFASGALIAQVPPAPEPPKFVVVLNAAHGGNDIGAKIGNQEEKDLTLRLSVKLRSLLMARGIYVVTTREADANINPDRRAEIANHASAAACIDLHAAQAGGTNSPSVHLFLSSLSATRHVGLSAWRTAQSASIRRSLALAGTINSALTQAGVTVTLGRAPLAAVDSMTCPAVAVEIAVLPSQQGSQDDSGFEAKVLDALAAAFLEWRADGAQLSGVRQP